MDHAKITAMIGGAENYGKGITPNPFVPQQKEWERRKANRDIRRIITNKIESLFEPRFITPPETSELIEAIVTATDSRMILELGTCTGFTTLHMLRAIIGKEAKIYSVDFRPAHDSAFWAREEFSDILEHVNGKTPEVLSRFHGILFDLVFIDSDHSEEHTVKELGALWPITKKGTIFLMHDLPEWDRPESRVTPPVRHYMMSKVNDGTFTGTIIPTCEQLDCLDMWGPGYPSQCNPHLGIFIRQ